MRPQRRFLLPLLLGLAFALLPAGPAPAGDLGQPDADQVAWRRAHLRKVVHELSQRDVAHLDEARRAARRRHLASLAAYAERGVFPVNDREDFRGLAMPWFIDSRGTRCAFAHLLDESGADLLLHRLASTANNAFVPEVGGDAEVRAWAVANGFTLEEIAFIQAPGYVDPGPGGPTLGPDDADATGPTHGGNTGRGQAGGTRRRGRGSATPTWETWWALNRHAFLDLREAYHEAAVVTPSSEAGDEERGARPRRPTRKEIDAVILPFLSEQARPRKGRETHATALMAWARAATAEQAPTALEAVLAYLRSPQSQYRDLLVLALGLLDLQEAREALVQIVQDRRRGRALLGRSESLDEATRALAALALSEGGLSESIPVLQGVLASARNKRLPDLRAACVASLGLLAREAEAKQRGAVARQLENAWKRERWPDEALGEIPVALARMGWTAASPRLRATLDRFRKPRRVRQNAALAIGHLAPALDAVTADTLIGTVRRDPDAAARRHALASLGELALRHGDAEDVGAKLARFYEAGFRGVHVNQADMTWFVLSAAMFGRGFEEHGDAIGKQLRRVAARDASREQRAASVVALALLGDRGAVPTLRKMLAEAADNRLRGFVAEALGVLGDRASRDALLELVVEDKNEHVRYHAALGLGFLADRELMPSLVAALRDVRSFPAQAALTRIIGEVGDRAAIAPLLQLARDPQADKWTRRRAIAALGMIAEERDAGWTADLKRGGNRTGAAPTLQRVMGLF